MCIVRTKVFFTFLQLTICRGAKLPGAKFQRNQGVRYSVINKNVSNTMSTQL